MADYYTLFSALFPVGSPANVAPALVLYKQLADELEEQGQTIGFEAQADDKPGGAELWLHDGGCGDPEHVIAFALRCAKVFGLEGLWGLRWCLWCSKPRLDGYGCQSASKVGFSRTCRAVVSGLDEQVRGTSQPLVEGFPCPRAYCP